MGTMQFGWSLGEADSQRVLSAAFEAGINFFDTADIYSKWAEGNPGGVSETYIGDWMKKNRIPAINKLKGINVVIAKKIGTPDCTSQYIKKSKLKITATILINK